MPRKQAWTAGLILLAFALCAPLPAQTEDRSLTIVATPNLRPVTRALLAAFQTRSQSVQAQVLYRDPADHGSGEAVRSADALLRVEIFGQSSVPQAGIAGTELVAARIQMAIWSTVRDVRHMGAANLLAPEFRRVVIADPNGSHSGRAARQILKQAGIWGPLHGRLVFAGTPEKATELVLSGAADAGLLQMPLIRRAKAGGKGNHAPLPQIRSLMPELRLGLTKRGAQKPLVLDFVSFVMSAKGQEILAAHGYSAP